MREKVSADDWVRAALRALARDGFTSVKADVLAKSLGVSRGSFYWHFENIDTFQGCVMQRWQEIATNAIILEVEARARGADRLPLLMHLAFAADSSLEIGMRAWASSYKPVIPFIETVDQSRLNYIAQLMIDAGLTVTLARTRAQVIYWTYLGSIQSGEKLKGAALKHLIGQLAFLSTLRTDGVCDPLHPA